MPKDKIKHVLNNPLLSSSALMIAGTNFANFLGYLYHLIFGRILGKDGYGELAAIISLVALITSLFTFFSLVIIKIVSSKDMDEVSRFYNWIIKKSLFWSGFLLIFLLIVSPFFAQFLNLDHRIALLIPFIIVLSFYVMVNSSFLQGLLKFKESVFINNLGWLGRITFGIMFIYLGFNLFGIIVAWIFSIIVSILMSKKFLKDIGIKQGEVEIFFKKDILSYSLPIFIMTLSLTSMFSTDIILAKYFLSLHEASIYAALSAMGKVIYFGANPIIGVVFPMVSKKASSNKPSGLLFLLGFGFTLFIVLVVMAIYVLFPEFSVGILFGKEFMEATPYLLIFSIFAGLFALNVYTVSYLISRNKTKSAYILFSAAIVQALGIMIFNSNISEIIYVSIFTNLGLLISLFFFMMFNFDVKYLLSKLRKIV